MKNVLGQQKMSSRIFDRKLKCGCLISSDGGGGLIDCHTKKCQYYKWMKTKDYKLHLKEVRERNK
jgi:hypothetical protein